MPIASKFSNFKGETQCYVVKLPKSAGAGQYCPKILRVPGTRGTRANSSPGEPVANKDPDIAYNVKIRIKQTCHGGFSTSRHAFE